MKEQLAEYIQEKIENYESMNMILKLQNSSLAQHGEGAVDALNDLLRFIDEEL